MPQSGCWRRIHDLRLIILPMSNAYREKGARPRLLPTHLAGRPSVYPEAKFDAVLKDVANGLTMTQALKDHNMIYDTFYRRAKREPEFAERWELAKIAKRELERAALDQADHDIAHGTAKAAKQVLEDPRPDPGELQKLAAASTALRKKNMPDQATLVNVDLGQLDRAVDDFLALGAEDAGP